ncbi:phosphotransferase [Streptomyces uncialis]|uniref:Aminoglycoside phosphotransferase n=1 Tax=Streptomyces uncialis TaxID=1048205 RepID=A0A1Q4VCM3_9ACTN|nr:phosphotransferase [Streptomyces uncialis]OKH95576.1 aminoglycoside phosphotransferase [Streptomyces uncialis]
MNDRVGWNELPLSLRTLIEMAAGQVIRADSVADGLNCSLAARVDTVGGGRLFLKGVRDDDLAQVAALACEDSLNEHVTGVSPPVLYRFRAEGWYCLAFGFVDGRYADLGTGSKDLGAVAAALRGLPAVPVPGLPVPDLAERFAGHLDRTESASLKGRCLLHTDLNPHNILIDGRTSAAWFLDWAMPAVGPPWVDPAYVAVRLMECGQPAGDALAWLSGFTSWRDADPLAVKAFVDGTCRAWTARIGERDATPSNERYQALLSGI